MLTVDVTIEHSMRLLGAIVGARLPHAVVSPTGYRTVEVLTTIAAILVPPILAARVDMGAQCVGLAGDLFPGRGLVQLASGVPVLASTMA